MLDILNCLNAHNFSIFDPILMILSFFLLILARSNFDHYARECNFGILKKKQKQNKKTKTKQKNKKSFGCVFN